MKTPTDREINAVFATASKAFLALFKKDVITQDDIISLTWIERYVIAQDLWQRCSKPAQRTLAHDKNPSVRAEAIKSLDEMIRVPIHRPMKGGSYVSAKNIHV